MRSSGQGIANCAIQSKLKGLFLIMSSCEHLDLGQGFRRGLRGLEFRI